VQFAAYAVFHKPPANKGNRRQRQLERRPPDFGLVVNATCHFPFRFLLRAQRQPLDTWTRSFAIRAEDRWSFVATTSLYRQGWPVEEDIVPLWPAISGALDAYRSNLSRFRVDLIQVEIN
jgi:hypothetical protein